MGTRRRTTLRRRRCTDDSPLFGSLQTERQKEGLKKQTQRSRVRFGISLCFLEDPCLFFINRASQLDSKAISFYVETIIISSLHLFRVYNFPKIHLSGFRPIQNFLVHVSAWSMEKFIVLPFLNTLFLNPILFLFLFSNCL